MVGEIINNRTVSSHKKGGTVGDKEDVSALNSKCVSLLITLIVEFNTSKNLYANLLAIAVGKGRQSTAEDFELMVESYKKLTDKFRSFLKAYGHELPDLNDIKELKMYEDLREVATKNEKETLRSLSELSKSSVVESDFISLALSQSAISIVIKHLDKVR